MASTSLGPSCDTPSTRRSLKLLLFCDDGDLKPSVRGPTFVRAVAMAHAVSYAHRWKHLDLLVQVHLGPVVCTVKEIERGS